METRIVFFFFGMNFSSLCHCCYCREKAIFVLCCLHPVIWPYKYCFYPFSFEFLVWQFFSSSTQTHTHTRYGMELVANKLLPSFKHFPWLYATNNKSWFSKWYVKSWNIFVSTDNSSYAVSLPLLPWCIHSKQFRNLWMHAFKSFLTFWCKLCGRSKFPHKIYTYTHPYITHVKSFECILIWPLLHEWHHAGPFWDFNFAI